MSGKSKRLALTVMEIAVAGVLAAFVLAVIWPGFRPPALWAKAFWALVVLLPVVAVSVGCLRQRPAARLVGWGVLSLVTIAIVFS
jgi:hypothetical protein